MKEEAGKISTQSALTVEEALASIKDEDFPTTMEEREKFCMQQLSAGEALFTKGIDHSVIRFLIIGDKKCHFPVVHTVHVLTGPSNLPFFFSPM